MLRSFVIWDGTEGAVTAVAAEAAVALQHWL
jgi:hypothetical protein